MRHADIINKMTLEQKAAFVSGADYWTLKNMQELGLPTIMLTDGSHGLRKKNTNKKASGGIGLGDSVPATCFPTAVTTACSWDMELLQLEGETIAKECLQEQVSVLLGPGTNIKRSPVCGRNFEYFSEDPYLAGKCAASFVNGVQAQGVGVSLKHFACNSQEAFRMVVNEVVDERAMREVYLTPFEICVKEARPWTVMNSYNRINGVYASQNHFLQEKILRQEWGFDGLLVTDWGASVDRVSGLKNGTDLEMPSSGMLNTKKIIEAVKNGDLSEEVLNERVDHVVDLILKAKPALEKKYSYDTEEHHKIAQKVAEGSMVLLKNDGILPLSTGQKIAVIGEMARHPRFQGAGTSLVNPTKLDNTYDQLAEMGVDLVYAQGYERMKEAVDVAKQADVAVVFVGLTEGFETEGYDRANMELPPSHNQLVFEITKANANTVVVLAGGSVIEMPWVERVKGLLHSGLGGQAGGAAVANILMGKVNPSGKTTETYPHKFCDNPTYGNYPGGPVTSEHRESIYVGYRYYDKADKEVLFPFGYGLSYTTFAYRDLTLSADSIQDTETVTVTFKIKNTGSMDGAEIAQIYVADEESTIFRPVKELKGFQKVFLKAGEEKEISMELSKRDFAFYNVALGDWMVETGCFSILVGASGRDIRLSATVHVTSTVDGEIPDYRMTAPAYYTGDIHGMQGTQFEAVYGKPLPLPIRDPAKKIDLYCCLEDAKHTKWGKRIGKLLRFVLSKMASADGGDSAMLTAMATQIPIRNFVAMSMGVFTPKMAEGLLMILNDDESTFIGFNKIFWSIGSALVKLPRLFRSI